MVEGTQVGGYRVMHRIGEGGMGSVWLAEHAMLGRRAAIKMLHAEFSNRREIVTRFFNEARAATAIADPGIVQIFDFGHHVDGNAYIVMELLDGEPLDKRVARLGVLGVPDALRIMRQVASTLGAAHARGIVHRDLKPENIYLVRDPEVQSGERAKVLDFGIAKLAGDQSGVKTQTSAVMGTPTYMSPEQCRGAGHVDQRSDVYALGCVLFRLLCGRPPFEADGVGMLIVMHMREAPPVPSSVRPGIPPDVDQLVLRCLAKDPAQRFASGAELAIAIGALIGSSPQLPASSSGYAIATAPTTLSSAAAAATTPAAPSRALTFAGLGLATAAVAAGVIYAATRGGSDNAASPAPAPVVTKPIATAPAAAQPVASPAAAPSAAAPTTAPPSPPSVDARLTTAMKSVLATFATWAADHEGAACPDVATLGVTTNDAWGHPFRITCTDQPADQIVGVVSSGPDGVAGTSDDIASWSLGRDVTDVVRGSRWTVTAAPAATSKKRVATKKPATGDKPAATPAKPKPSGGMLLDENGLPISR